VGGTIYAAAPPFPHFNPNNSYTYPSPLATREKAGYSTAMTKYGSRTTQFAELNELLGQIVPQIKSILGDNFVGAYLQGSFALGAADMYSDCDFLIVARRALTSAFHAAADGVGIE